MIREYQTRILWMMVVIIFSTAFLPLGYERKDTFPKCGMCQIIFYSRDLNKIPSDISPCYLKYLEKMLPFI